MLHSRAFLAPKMGTVTVRKIASKQALGVRDKTGGGTQFSQGPLSPLPPLATALVWAYVLDLLACSGEGTGVGIGGMQTVLTPQLFMWGY